MSIDIFVPRDSGALSLGAEAVALALKREAQSRGIDIRMVRNGSRGLSWLEPLVEVSTPQGRHAYGPVTPGDVAGRYAADLLQGGAQHPLYLGATAEIPY